MADLIKLPLLPLRGMMVFPYMIINLDVGRDRSVAALEEAMVQNRQIMLTAQRDPEIDAPKLDELYEVGTVAEVKQLLKLPGPVSTVKALPWWPLKCVNLPKEARLLLWK